MTSRNPNAKDTLKPFNKGFDKRRKGNGRKPLTYTSIIKELKDKGYIAPTKNEYYEFISLLLVMDEAAIMDYAKDTEKPLWTRLLIKDLTSSKTRERLMKEYSDWLYGKAQERIDISNSDGTMKFGYGDEKPI
jgi:reverse gyrase